MNTPRLLVAIVAAFVFIFGSDFLIHTVLLDPDYKATSQLWRTEPEMMTRFPWMIAGHLLAATTFVIIWALGFTNRRMMGMGTLYGLLMGLFAHAYTVINYVVTPIPGQLSTKVFLTGLVQAVLLGVITAAIYKFDRGTSERRN